MRDLFLVYHGHDHLPATNLAQAFAACGVTLAEPVELWPEMRLLQRIDAGLVQSRFALVLVSNEFLNLSYPARDLDGLSRRSKVLCLLHGVDEVEVARHSPRLATIAISGCMVESLVRLVRHRG